MSCKITFITYWQGERGGSVVECRTLEREVRGSRPTAAVLCPWARHFTPQKYWLITQEAMAPSRHDWKIVDWDVKPQHNQPTNLLTRRFGRRTGGSVSYRVSFTFSVNLTGDFRGLRTILISKASGKRKRSIIHWAETIMKMFHVFSCIR